MCVYLNAGLVGCANGTNRVGTLSRQDVLLSRVAVGPIFLDLIRGRETS